MVLLETFQREPQNQENRAALMACLIGEVEKTKQKRAYANELLIDLDAKCQSLEDELVCFQEELKGGIDSTKRPRNE